MSRAWANLATHPLVQAALIRSCEPDPGDTTRSHLVITGPHGLRSLPNSEDNRKLLSRIEAVNAAADVISQHQHAPFLSDAQATQAHDLFDRAYIAQWGLLRAGGGDDFPNDVRVRCTVELFQCLERLRMLMWHAPSGTEAFAAALPPQLPMPEPPPHARRATPESAAPSTDSSQPLPHTTATSDRTDAALAGLVTNSDDLAAVAAARAAYPRLDQPGQVRADAALRTITEVAEHLQRIPPTLRDVPGNAGTTPTSDAAAAIAASVAALRELAEVAASIDADALHALNTYTADWGRTDDFLDLNSTTHRAHPAPDARGSTSGIEPQRLVRDVTHNEHQDRNDR